MAEKRRIKVGITGQSGFIGSHLFNYLGTKKEEIERIEFKDEYFNDERLNNFIRECDVIIHLAAVIRHPNPKLLYETNLELIRKIIKSTEEVGHYPHIIYSSSTQEGRDNAYGKSKYEGRVLFEEWAQRHNSIFNALIIPNVFGPFSKPFYNSIISTYCFQLTHYECPKVELDRAIKLIYITDLTEIIYKIINEKETKTHHLVCSGEKKFSEILNLLTGYKETYLKNGIIPELSNQFEISLFNTFRSYIDLDKFNIKLIRKCDQRGYLIENFKTFIGGETFFSLTLPGITRGNHFHMRKIERFCIIEGEGIIRLRKIGTKNIIEIPVKGAEPSVVDIPVWFTHNITNTGKDRLLTIFWTSKIFDPDDPDTYCEQV
jgi:UDP-2-acetamido-2,6-beta-L-arabino-hexul-4-ose reductase